MKRTSRNPKKSSRTTDDRREGRVGIDVQWKANDQTWLVPLGEDPVVSLAIQSGLDPDIARKTPSKDLREALNLTGKLTPVINEERLLAVVPGNLDHKGEDVIIRRYLDTGSRFNDFSWPESSITHAIKVALNELQRKGLIMGGQGARGEGWTRVDAAFRIAREKEKREREKQEMIWEEEERRQEAVQKFAKKFGVEEGRYGRYDWQDVEKILLGLKVKL
jgi:hypothetical protein